MMRTCSADDPHIGDGSKRCGLTFDDVEHSTICPHPRLPTFAEKQAALDVLAAEGNPHAKALAQMYREQHG